MRLWIALVAIAVLLVTYIAVHNQTASDSRNQTTAAIDPTTLPKPVVRKKVSRAQPVESPAEESQTETDLVVSPSDQQPSEPAAEVKPNAPPDMLAWKAEAAAEPVKTEDPIMILRSTETVRPDDGPVLSLTYGDAPGPNIKIEHRAWGLDTTPEPPTDFFISQDRPVPSW